MKTLRYLSLYLLLSLISLSAWNLDSKKFDGIAAGPVPVRALFMDDQGNRWIGTDRGLYRWDQVDWSYYTDSDFLAGNQVLGLAFEQTGSGPEIWVATSKGVSVLAYDVDGITAATSLTTEDGLLDDSITSVVVDTFQRKYFGSESGISLLLSGSVEYLIFTEQYQHMANAPVNTLHMHNDTLYVGADGGIGRFVAGVDAISGASRWTSEYGMTPLSGNIKSVFVDSRGHQWFGTDEGVEEHIGLKAKENWNLYTTADGLINGYVLSIAEDAEGGMWFGTRGGVSRFLEGTWTSFTTAEGLASDTVYAISMDPDGSVWFGTHRGVSRLQGLTFQNLFTSLPEYKTDPVQFFSYSDALSRTVRVKLHLESPATIYAEVYSLDGRLCVKSDPMEGSEGLNEIVLDPHQGGLVLSSGIYLVRVNSGGKPSSGKVFINP